MIKAEFPIAGSAPAGFQPGRWSLSEMINFMLPHYMTIHTLIYQEISLADANRCAGGDAAIDGADKDRIRQNMQFPLQKAREYGLETVENRIERIIVMTRPDTVLTLSEVIRQMQTLLEALTDDTKYLYLYAYPKEKAKRFIRWRTEWSAALGAFKGIEADVDEATDIYALGKNTACVFHSMRVLEKGIESLAKAVGMSYSRQNWYNVLNEIEAAIRKMQALPNSPTKADDLKFYSEAAKEFFYFKDGWRNYVSHGGDAYDEHQALGTMEHVRAFMNHLASRLSETP